MTNKTTIKKHICNALMSDIINDMFENSLYSNKYDTCEKVGALYVDAFNEVITELINTQHLYPDYFNRNK